MSIEFGCGSVICWNGSVGAKSNPSCPWLWTIIRFLSITGHASLWVLKVKLSFLTKWQFFFKSKHSADFIYLHSRCYYPMSLSFDVWIAMHVHISECIACKECTMQHGRTKCGYNYKFLFWLQRMHSFIQGVSQVVLQELIPETAALMAPFKSPVQSPPGLF